VTRPRLAVALDVADEAAARGWAERLRGHADVLKVGLQLFTACGPSLVRELVAQGWGVFLDLKLHDIPATVAGATAAACDLGVELLTVHASGGPRMLEAAVRARGDASTRLLGVSVLTSLGRDDLERLGWQREPISCVVHLCAMARDCGCDGVVASVHETGAVRAECGEGLVIATPGIRPAGSAVDDQARVATPAAAVEAGADYLVVGRPILRAADPVLAAREIRSEMMRATARSNRGSGGDPDGQQ